MPNLVSRVFHLLTPLGMGDERPWKRGCLPVLGNDNPPSPALVSISFNLKTPQCIFVLTLPSPDNAFPHFLGENALN